MGGKEGSRGYLYQAIASVLNSLNEEGWKYVQIEPDSQNDKIDVLWEYENNKKKAMQVKSSANNISRANVIIWLEELIKDAEGLEEVSLLLIGSCNDSTKKFINQLVKNKGIDLQEENEGKFELPDTIKLYSGNIHIQLENFKLDTLQSVVNIALDRFLTNKGHFINYYRRELFTSAIINEFQVLSTEGKKISKQEFEQKILDWVYHTHKEKTGHSLDKNDLAVHFYLKNIIKHSAKMSFLQYTGLPGISYIKNKRESLLELLNKIRTINLPANKLVATEELAHRKQEPLGILRREYEYMEILDNKKEDLIDKVSSLLGEFIDESFFYVGGLKVFKARGMNKLLGVEETTIEGTRPEKEKGELIKEFIQLLEHFDATIDYIKYVGNFLVVPLVLREESQIYNEDIKVNLKFPNFVKVATKRSLKIPDNIDFIDESIESNSFLQHLLTHPQDSKITKNNSYLYYRALRKPKDFFEKRDLEDAKSDFYRYLSCLFNSEVFVESNGTVLKYKFEKISASESIAFPSIILVNADRSFEIDYEITSKKSNGLIKGKLFYEV